MSDLYFDYDGSRYVSGETYRIQGVQIRIDLEKSRIVSTVEVPDPSGSTFRRDIISGEFTYQANRLTSGRVKTATTFTARQVNGSFEETASSYNLKEGIVAAYPFQQQYYLPQDATSVNYYYASLPGSSIGQGQFMSVLTIHDRVLLKDLTDSYLAPDGWWNSPFSTSASGTVGSLTGTAKKGDVFALTGTPEFGAGTADRITNFNPKEKDKLQIDVSDFGSDAAGTFKIAKNSKALTKALASTTDFIYLKSTGELYYNENGKLPGFGEGGVFAILENKANITVKNVEFL